MSRCGSTARRRERAHGCTYLFNKMWKHRARMDALIYLTARSLRAPRPVPSTTHYHLRIYLLTYSLTYLLSSSLFWILDLGPCTCFSIAHRRGSCAPFGLPVRTYLPNGRPPANLIRISLARGRTACAVCLPTRPMSCRPWDIPDFCVRSDNRDLPDSPPRSALLASDSRPFRAGGVAYIHTCQRYT